MSINKSLLTILGVLVIFTGVFLAAFLLPWRVIEWGTLNLAQDKTITVSGYAQIQKENQKAQFSAGVTVYNDDKEEAVNEVNEAMTKIVEDVKNFGIPAEDIKTQNISIYQNQDQYSEEGSFRMRPGQWVVSNSVEIVLREANVEKSSQFADVLFSSGATNVYGPSFMIDDDNNEDEAFLINSAIEDAKRKAEIVAESSGKRLGDVVSVIESEANQPGYPIPYRAEGMGGGAPMEPGTSIISKSLIVVFEAK